MSERGNMTPYQILHRQLWHIFRNIDTQSMILDCQLEKPRKTSKKDFTLIRYEKTLQKTLRKIQIFLHYNKFKKLEHCRCLHCFEDYENFNVAYHNLLKHLPKTIALISKMKNENMKRKDEVIFLNKVKILLEEACVQCGKISLATNCMNQTMGSPSPTLFYYKRQN